MRTVDGVVLAALLLSPWPVLADASDEPTRAGRLKFREGPPCMCNDGLGEQAIREAEQRRKRDPQQRDMFSPASSQENKTEGE